MQFVLSLGICPKQELKSVLPGLNPLGECFFDLYCHTIIAVYCELVWVCGLKREMSDC